ncbi:MAG: cache domain-containing protein [Polaromonas sp.]|nr:cache domain-containing protein [Polaromonas sp.]
MNDVIKRSSLDIGTHLSMLVLVCVVPAALSVLWLVVSEFNLGQDRLAHDARERTRAVVNAIDREFATVQAAMGGLATSTNISTGNLALFQAQASQVLKDLQDQEVLFSNIVLSDAAGQQLVNTRTEFGTVLPRHGNEALVQKIVSTGLPAVSDLFTGNVSGVKVVNVGIPIRSGGKVSYVLTAAISTKAIADVVTRHKFPESWIAVVIDSGGTIVARAPPN